MLIERLWRKVLASDYSVTTCAICGNDFDRGIVFPVAKTDDGAELGEMCPTCLEYLNRRKEDAEDPTLDNWPARGCPRLRRGAKDLRGVRRVGDGGGERASLKHRNRPGRGILASGVPATT